MLRVECRFAVTTIVTVMGLPLLLLAVLFFFLPLLQLVTTLPKEM